jgi:hypothetical protein
MKSTSDARADHVFRLAKPPSGVIKESKKSFLEEQTRTFREWADYSRHKAVVQDSLTRQIFSATRIDPTVKFSLAALRASLDSRMPKVMDAPFSGPPIFQMKPGLNIIGPPYDFGLHVALGSNQPAIINSIASGSFSVVATAPAGKNTFGSAGVALFIVPSNPGKTLSIRPYYTWFYIYTCESHGPPTAHSSGVISASVSGRKNDGSSMGLPGKSAQLWSAGSDIWDDAHGEDSNVFGIPEGELIVSGFDFYTVSYVCQVSADANKSSPWWAVSYAQLHCKVPFIVVEEF